MSRLAAILALAGGLGLQAQVGEVAFPNSGSPAAQTAFLHGLAQLHNFEYDDAARAFREAQQIDPSFAMAYWGEAMTKNHPVWEEQDLGGARRILARLASTAAARVEKAGTPRERAYLRAMDVLYGAGDKHERDLAYLAHMRQLHAAYPDDVDGAAFYALALLGSTDSGRDTMIYMQAAAVLEDAFAQHPDHPGVAHYLIHAYDDPAHAPLGLRAARRYSGLAPAAPHALHMTSHIYLAAGMWDDVVAANERATQVSAERARRAGLTPAACGHANMWLLYGYLQQGRRADARRALDACRAAASRPNGTAVRAPEQDPFDPDNTAAGSYVQMWSRYVIDTEDWAAAAAPDRIELGDLAGAALTYDYVRALGAAMTGADATVLRERLASVERAQQAQQGQRYRSRGATIASQVRALVDIADGRPDDAIGQLRDLAEAEQDVPVEFGPPLVDKPTHELLGDLLLRAGRNHEAVDAYRAALRRTPNRTAALHGLARAAGRSGDAATAAETYGTLRAIWQHADALPDDVKAAAAGRPPMVRF